MRVCVCVCVCVRARARAAEVHTSDAYAKTRYKAGDKLNLAGDTWPGHSHPSSMSYPNAQHEIKNNNNLTPLRFPLQDYLLRLWYFLWFLAW